MPPMFYVQRGDVPHKRHTQFRKPDGGLYAEELFGVEGFSGRASLLYHHTPPTQTHQIEKVR
ncbi:MAG: homogentisate 1,2-dioxygenase, partial [Chloroflexota bacterium]|nr:homogentisate 1,2-dioxygenase [Chloroflexota bacterium]